MRKSVRIVLILLTAVMFTACGVVIDGRNLKINDNGADIVSIGEDGFRLEGNLTGITLDGNGLRIEYPNGNLIWDDGGLNIRHSKGDIRIADGAMVITDKEGNRKELDTTGAGAEYRTDSGVLVRTGEKATLPEEYPHDVIPLMEGFELDASALLGSVNVVTGHVPGKSVDDATAHYAPLLDKGSSFSRENKAGSVVLRAKLDGLDVTVYLINSLTANAVNVSVVVGK